MPLLGATSIASSPHPLLGRAEQGDLGSQITVAMDYYRENDYPAALHWLRIVADRGNTTGQYVLGEMHQHGFGVRRNIDEAIRWYRAAAEQDHPGAQYVLGGIYRSQRPDPGEAVCWYRAAAAKNFRDSKALLAQVESEFSTRHPDQSPHALPCARSDGLTQLIARAEAGDTLSQYLLGMRYQHGIQGVAQDYNQMRRWYRAAADQGDADAQFWLAVADLNGWGAPKNDPQSFALLLSAARQGHAEAQTQLGVSYRDARGTARNMDEAESWFRKAAEQGSEGAKRSLATLPEYRRADAWNRSEQARQTQAGTTSQTPIHRDQDRQSGGIAELATGLLTAVVAHDNLRRAQANSSRQVSNSNAPRAVSPPPSSAYHAPATNDPSRSRLLHNPAADAGACVRLVPHSNGRSMVFENHCGVTVEIFWCSVTRGDCDRAGSGGGNTWSLGAGRTWGVGNDNYRWGACLGANSGRFDRDRQGMGYTCPSLDPPR